MKQTHLDMIRNLSNNENDYNDNVKAFLTFGHLFDYNPAVTLAHTYCLHGKPALNADAMAGAVRRYVDKSGKKVCAAIWEEIGEDYVTVYALRRDELELAKEFNLDIKPKKWTYTLEDARKRGTLNQRAWKTMPLVMLHKRALTALLRLAFPEIIGTACSPDELAEVMIKDEAERDRIIYASVESERVPQNIPAAEEPKKKTKPKALKAAPGLIDQIHNESTNPLRDFSTIQTTIEELKKEGVDTDEALLAMEKQSNTPLTQAPPAVLEKLFYEFGLNPIRKFAESYNLGFQSNEFKKWKKEDLNTLASHYSVYFGTSFDPAIDQDVSNYCYRVNSFTSSGAWVETMIILRRLLDEELINQATFNENEKSISTYPTGTTYYSIMKTLGIE